MNKTPIALGIGLTIGAAAGYFAGYKIAYKKLGADFDKRIDEEVAEMRIFYNNVHTKKYATPQEAVADLIKEDPDAEAALEEYQGEPEEKDPREGKNNKTAYNLVVSKLPSGTIDTSLVAPPNANEVVPEEFRRNIFKDRDNRDPNKPYVISKDEFEAAEAEFIQQTVTWYAGDSVLTDEREDKYDDPDPIVGLTNLEHFGEVSEDPNIVHVRNEKLRLDFEVVRDPDAYYHAVLGIEHGEANPDRPSGRS